MEKQTLDEDIQRFLEEDLGSAGDITSDTLFSEEKGKAHIIAKEEGILAGVEEITLVFQIAGAAIQPLVNDGAPIDKGKVIAEITGPVRAILKAERLVLNILGRMSGIATETHTLVDICQKKNPSIKIAATRKTTPGFRRFEKKAVQIGGGDPHRFGLYDAFLIKDNHLKIMGSLEKAVQKVRETIPDKPIEVEVENEHDALTAATLHVDIIMLDNFQPKIAEQVAQKIRDINPQTLIEVSGGITHQNIESYTFADRISLGALTHSVKNIDFSLEIL